MCGDVGNIQGRGRKKKGKGAGEVLTGSAGKRRGRQWEVGGERLVVWHERVRSAMLCFISALWKRERNTILRTNRYYSSALSSKSRMPHERVPIAGAVMVCG